MLGMVWEWGGDSRDAQHRCLDLMDGKNSRDSSDSSESRDAGDARDAGGFRVPVDIIGFDR